MFLDAGESYHIMIWSRLKPPPGYQLFSVFTPYFGLFLLKWFQFGFESFSKHGGF